MKILVTIPSFSNEARRLLDALGDIEYKELTNETIKEVIGQYDALLVGLGTTYTKEVLEAASHLKVIATATTGLDHIDVACAEARGITILSLRGEREFLDTITGTGELALGLMIALMRSIPASHEHVVAQGLWDREQFRGHSLYGKTLGIVGMGRLGKIVGEAASALRMRVVYTDPHVDPAAYGEYGHVVFKDLLTQSDVISIHCHLTKETERMFNTEAFNLMKAGAYLINTARGGIVDEEALLSSLEAGHLAGYATDVLDGELDFSHDSAKEHPLVRYASSHKNVLVTPHIGGMTVESRRDTDLFMAKKLLVHVASSRPT